MKKTAGCLSRYFSSLYQCINHPLAAKMRTNFFLRIDLLPLLFTYMLSIPCAVLLGSKKSITDFFMLPPNARMRVPTPDPNIISSSKAPATVSTAGVSTRKRVPGRPISAGGNLRSVGTSDIPTWMCIPGTSFRVVGYALAYYRYIGP